MAPKAPKINLTQIMDRIIIGIFICTILFVVIASFVDTPVKEKKGKMLIDGPYCKFPEMKITPTNKIPVIRDKSALIPCTTRAVLTKITDSTVYDEPLRFGIQSQHLSSYGVSNMSCCYHSVKRKTETETDISEECIPFQHFQELNRDIATVYVKCSSEGKEIYSNLHTLILQQQRFVKRQIETGINNKTAFRVLMIGLDGVSRMSLQRGLPLTYGFVSNKSEWFEMKGYTRLGNKTFQNIFSVLTGKSADEKYGNCDPQKATFLDDCGFIWKDYERAGYVTVYAEDQSAIHTFNTYHKGFKNQPTDHYFRPYAMTAEKKLKLRNIRDLVFCLGQTPYIDTMLTYIEKMAVVHVRDPYFGLFYINSLSDKQLMQMRPMDRRLYKEFNTELHISKMNDTIIIFFSDTGIRNEENLAGFYEQRSPFLHIRLPLKFQKAHPDFVRNLRMNTNRLTTPYDLHITLRHILNLSAKKKVAVKASGCQNCKSLFEVIPFARDCNDANIPHDSCPCSLVNLSNTQQVVKFGAQYAVDELNKELADMSTEKGECCAKLKLANITFAKQQPTSPWNMNYIIQFTVTPSKARFEVLLKRKFSSLFSSEPVFELMHDVTHIKKISELNACVPRVAAAGDEMEKRIENYDYEDYVENMF